MICWGREGEGDSAAVLKGTKPSAIMAKELIR